MIIILPSRLPSSSSVQPPTGEERRRGFKANSLDFSENRMGPTGLKAPPPAGAARRVCERERQTEACEEARALAANTRASCAQMRAMK